MAKRPANLGAAQVATLQKLRVSLHAEVKAMVDAELDRFEANIDASDLKRWRAEPVPADAAAAAVAADEQTLLFLRARVRSEIKFAVEVGTLEVTACVPHQMPLLEALRMDLSDWLSKLLGRSRE